jgi:hypothetical protein
MTGPNICLHHHLDLYIGDYRFHGRDGIYVSAAFLGCGRPPRANIFAGRQLQVVNITGKYPAHHVARGAHTHFRQGFRICAA